MNWNVHFLNYVSNYESKLFLSVHITEQGNCRELREDIDHSSYPYKIAYIIFCIDLEGNPYLWHLNITLNPSFLIDVKQLRNRKL